MKKIYIVLMSVFMCISAASADPSNFMAPAGTPMMQTIQNNAINRTLPEQIEKQKEKDVKLEELKKESFPELNKEDVELPSIQKTLNNENLSEKDAIEMARKEAIRAVRYKREQEFLKEEQLRLEKKSQKELKKAEKTVSFKKTKTDKKQSYDPKNETLEESIQAVSVEKKIKTKKVKAKATKEKKEKVLSEKTQERKMANQEYAVQKKLREEAFHQAIAKRTELKKQLKAENKSKKAQTKLAQKEAKILALKNKAIAKGKPEKPITKEEKKAFKKQVKADKITAKNNRAQYRENAKRTDLYERERAAEEKAAKKREMQALRDIKKENPQLAKQKADEQKAELAQQSKIDKAMANEIKIRNKEIAKKQKEENSHFKDGQELVLVQLKKQEEARKVLESDENITDEPTANQAAENKLNKMYRYNLQANKDTDEERVSVYIKKIEFSPSEIFTEKELLEMAGPLLGESVSMKDIKNLINSINRKYIINDYVTSRAYLPPQKIEDGVLKINLFEGKVGEVIVRGNAWTRKSYITNRLGLEEGEMFKLRVLEKSLIKFNNDHYDYTKNSFSIKAKLAPGKEPGTTDIIVDANDPLPFRITGVFDNQGRDTIGLLRGGVMASTDSLTGNRDKLSLGSYFGRGTQIYFGDYSIPINKYGTRAGVSASYNHIDVIRGPYTNFDISGKAYVYTAYLSHPIINRPDMSLTSYTAGNFKYSKTYFTDVPIYDAKTASGTQGLTLRKDTKKGIWYTGHYATVGYMDTIPAHEMYWKYDGNITRLHDFGHGIIGQFRASAQVAPSQTLPWMEQFQVGGLSSVRGYSEGLLIGRSGYFMSAELITPIPFLPKKVGTEKLGFINLRDMVKLALFFDHGAVFPYKGVGGGGANSSDVLASIGPGLRFRINDYLNARVYWGFGLIQNKYETKQASSRFHFELTSSPDLAALLKYRKYREPQSEKL